MCVDPVVHLVNKARLGDAKADECDGEGPAQGAYLLFFGDDHGTWIILLKYS